MPAGSELTSDAIAPGSMAYGDRGPLEQGLSSAMGGGGGAPQGGAPAPTALPTPENPLGALLSGQVGGGDTPITDGLSVGPGANPVTAPDQMLGDRASRLRMIATEAASPQMRELARSMLRRMAREPL